MSVSVCLCVFVCLQSYLQYYISSTTCTWVHKKCSGIKGSISKVAKSFIFSRRLNPITSAGRNSVDIGASASWS